MTPYKKIYIFTVRAYGPNDEKRKISFLASDSSGATYRFVQFYKEKYHGWRIKTTSPTCCGENITEVHCLKYSRKFQLVNRGNNRGFDSDNYDTKSPILTKLEYNPINRTYLCVDTEGNKHYVDAYEWCIVKEEKENENN